MNTLADPANIDCLNPKSEQYGQCVDIVNCDLSEEHVATTREGCTLAFAGNVSSCWTSSAGITYCVYGGYLCTYNGTAITPLTIAFTVLAACEFEQVNDIVVFSDNVKIGTIVGSTVTRIDVPADWVSVENLSQWVHDHAPANPADWNGVTSNSNFEVDAFALSTKAGKCLHFFAGVLYLAINNFVYATKTFDVSKMDIRYNVVAGFPDNVTMIQHVDNGLYIGTTKACYFLASTGVVVGEDGKYKSGFKQTQVLPYGAIYGTDLTLSAELIPDLRSKDIAALWSTAVGIFAGVPGGTVTNLSAGKVVLSDAVSGAALFKDQDGLRQYIVAFSGGAWVLNLNKLTHSRFTAFPYTSLFKLGAFYYGADSHAIVKFGGETDYVGATGLTQQLDSFILTPSTNFGTGKVKRVRLVHAKVRRTAAVAIDCIVDELPSYEDGGVPRDGVTTAHTIRQKAPRGAKGVYWQFRFRKVGGGKFSIFNLEPVVDTSATRTK